MSLPEILAQRCAWSDDENGGLLKRPWADIPPLPGLRESSFGKEVRQRTDVRVCCDAMRLYVRFDCEDRDIWATYTRRDEPLYEEEVAELFIASGTATPKSYYEIEINPLGAVFDALIHNPTGGRAGMRIDSAWDCVDIETAVQISTDGSAWTAAMAVPWSSIGGEPSSGDWRLNFYRIDRPRGGEAEFSAWSPTLAVPADFHRPDRFGLLRRPMPMESLTRYNRNGRR